MSGRLGVVVSSTPGFWVGVRLLPFFSFRLRLSPAVGSGSVSSRVLPAVTLALGLIGVFTQVLRAGIERKTDLAIRMLGRPWDAFVTVYAESHCAGHQFWWAHDPSHPRYTPWLKHASAVFAFVIGVGFCSVPIAVLAGLVR